jgi:two-component system C4-dicarboxylate transport sensor histidine kinase DctB
VRKTVLGILLSLAVALVIIHFAQRQLSTVWPALGVHPQVTSAMRRSMEDLKRLSELDPARTAEYRRRHEELRALHNRLEILRSGQEEIARLYERILFAVVAVTLAALGAFYVLRRRREERRLQNVRSFIERLSSGEQHLRVGERGGDAIARMAQMIESTSDVIATERQRLRYLENLAGWQEAARRHSHEIRTPLTAVRLELDRLCSEVENNSPQAAGLLVARRQSIQEELDRLSEFTRNFTAFAAIGRPRLGKIQLGAFLREFVETYAKAWPLRLHVDEESSACAIEGDRGMLRQVLVNLCANSALAGASTVTLGVRHEGRTARIDLRDDGPGIPAAIRARLFQPYTTSRSVGEGMGLGLAISRKILLDHSGDLELASTSTRGTTFTLTLPCIGHEVPS